MVSSKRNQCNGMSFRQYSYRLKCAVEIICDFAYRLGCKNIGLQEQYNEANISSGL